MFLWFFVYGAVRKCFFVFFVYCASKKMFFGSRLATSLLKKKGDRLMFEWWRSVWEKVKRAWRKNRFFVFLL